MGRPSKLTPEQWEALRKRLLAGETARVLGREFGISDTAIHKKFGANQEVSLQSLRVRNVAQKLAESSEALESLPISQRPVAIDLASKLRNISASLDQLASNAA